MNVALTKEITGNATPYILKRALAPIQSFLDDPSVIEISINKPESVFVERLGSNGMEFHSIPTLGVSELSLLAEQVAACTAQFVNDEHPILSTTLPTGERVQVVLPPAAPDGGAISIRKHVVNRFTLEDYRDNGGLSKVTVARTGLSDSDRSLIQLLDEGNFYAFIKKAIEDRQSILVSGSTSSGKTTFLNTCLNTVAQDERIITIEDARELEPPQANVVHLIASKGNQGKSAVTIQDLLEASLRMRPDRLLVGEVRDNEVFSFLQAINTGHPGSMTTIHADTPAMAFERLALMVMQSGMGSTLTKADIIAYIKSVIPIVIQLRRDNGRRGVSEIFFARHEQ